MSAKLFREKIKNYSAKTCKKRIMLVYLYHNLEAKLQESCRKALRLTKPTRRVYEGLPKNFTHILCPDKTINLNLI